MKPKDFLVVALDEDSDHIGAELITAIRWSLGIAEADHSTEAQPLQASLAARFFGVGGPEMKQARMELIYTRSNQTDAILAANLFKITVEREPDVVICIGDEAIYGKLAHTIRSYVQKRCGTFFNWSPVLMHVSLSEHADKSANNKHFDAVLALQENEVPFDLVSRVTDRVIELLASELKSFPLKASLGT